MATISGLRETLRYQVGDLARLVKEKRFQNEQLENALFNALQQHNRAYTWATLPQAEEQLVLLLAKARLAKDKSLEYALDPKIASGTGFSREKTANASMLMELSRDFYEEYKEVRDRLAAVDGTDIIMGELTRRSWTTHQIVPGQAAKAPGKPAIYSAEYVHDASTGKGTVRFSWYRPTDYDLAYIRVYQSRNPVIGLNDSILRTIYDLYGDPGSYVTPPIPVIPPSIPRLAQQYYEQEATFTPGGRWYLALAAFNWNMLYTFSEAFPLDVVKYADLTADIYVVEAA